MKGKQSTRRERRGSPAVSIKRVAGLIAALPVCAVAQVVLPPVVVNDVADGYNIKQITTATKTDTDLRDTPQSVTVVSEQQIKDTASQGLGEALRYVPGVSFAQGEGNRETPIFRGVSTTADFYVDGVRDDVQYYRDLYNIEQVEVFKGPNAMIFGRGATGGLINRVTKVPTAQAKKDIAFTYGSDNNRRVTFDINQPLSPTVGFRLNGLYEDSDSYRDGVWLTRKGINPTLSIQAAPSTKLTFGYEYFQDDRIADRGITSYANGSGPVQTGRSTFFGNAEGSPTGTSLNAVTALVEHAFNSDVELRNRTRYSDQDKFYQNVYATTTANAAGDFNVAAYNLATVRKSFFNQTDLITKFNTGSVKHKLLMGAEFGEQDTANFRNTGFFPGNATTITANINNPGTIAPVTYRQNATDADNKSTAKIAAVYVQDQIEFNKYVHLIAGLRYDSFKVDFTNNRTGANFTSNDGLVSPRLGMIVKPIEPLSLYANYSVAYQPRSGDQISSLSATNVSLTPEKFENYEIGAKWDVAKDLSATAALYRLNRTNMIVLTNPNDQNSGVLSDGQRTNGFEFGLTGKVTRDWTVSGGYGYTDATFIKDTSATVRAGAHVAGVPKHTFTFWNRYDFNDRFGAGVGLIHRTKYFASNEVITVNGNVELPAYTRVDTALFVKLDKTWRAQVNVENLFDEKYYVFANSNTNITPGSPRAFRVSLFGNF